MKITNEIKSEIRKLRLSGLTHKDISERIGISRKSVTCILNYNISKNGVSCCPYCGSSRTLVKSTRNRNPGRESTMYYVNCNSCHAKGPRFSYFDRDRGNPEIIEEKIIQKAIDSWNDLAMY